VTGAARGIGAATVLALAERGWSILAVDLAKDDPALPYPMASAADLAETVRVAERHGAAWTDERQSEATERGGKTAPGSGLGRWAGPLPSGGSGGSSPRACTVVGYYADVRDQAALDAVVAEAEERWGGLDAAIAAAGVIAGGAPLWELPPEQEQAVLDVDLGGVIKLARAAIPALLRRPQPRSGRFLAVASAAATSGMPTIAAYCAAKAGVAGLIRALGAELGGTGVTANAVSPGSTDTAMLAESARLYGLADPSSFASQQPLGRLLDPAEIAAVLAFLAGPGSSAMTGSVIPVDGGLAL